MKKHELRVGMIVTQDKLGYDGIITQLEPTPIVEWWKWFNEFYRDPLFAGDIEKLVMVQRPLQVGDFVKANSPVTWGMLIEKTGQNIPGEKDVILPKGTAGKITNIARNGWIEIEWALPAAVDPKYHNYAWNPVWFRFTFVAHPPPSTPHTGIAKINPQPTLTLDSAQIELLRKDLDLLRYFKENQYGGEFQGDTEIIEGVIADLDAFLGAVKNG